MVKEQTRLQQKMWKKVNIWKKYLGKTM